jgi:hypothetical protein
MVGGRSGSSGNRRPMFYYGCTYHQNRGRTICTNDHRARMEEADALVIEKVRDVLTPTSADYTVDQWLEKRAARQRGRADMPDQLDAEARRLRKELDRLLRVISGGTAPASVLMEIQHRVARLAEIARGPVLTYKDN